MPEIIRGNHVIVSPVILSQQLDLGARLVCSPVCPVGKLLEMEAIDGATFKCLPRPDFPALLLERKSLHNSTKFCKILNG